MTASPNQLCAIIHLAHITSLAGGLFGLTTTFAAAQGYPVAVPEDAPLPGVEVAPDSESPLSVSFGVDFTTNYLSKGFTQTDDKPAIQPYLEVGYGPVYLLLWGSNVDFGEKDIELDVEVGIATTIGNVDLAFGFAQYFYREDDDDYGEAFFNASYPVNESLSVGFNYWHEVYADYDTLYLEAEYSGLPNGLAMSGGIGSDFGTRDLEKDANYGDVGLTWEFANNFAFDIRGHYSEIEDERLVATFSIFY